MISTLILYLFYIRKVFFEGTSKSSTAFFTVRTQLCTEVYGVPCPQINNSKLGKLRQISNRKLKAVKELYLGWKLPVVHAIPGLCTVNVFDYEISLRKFRKHHRLGMATLSVGAYLWFKARLGHVCFGVLYWWMEISLIKSLHHGYNYSNKYFFQFTFI